MQWWTWLLLWVAVLAVTGLGFVLLGIHLWRQVRKLLSQVSESASLLSEISTNNQQSVVEYTPSPSSVFADPETERAAYVQGKNARRLARTQRRVQRRAVHGRPQNLRDVGLDKA